ncbi:Diatom spindle kinesin-1 [Hondaea fermentalgiana]|uniref:Kinesin-like protein n=1 Tax=Hondaea fermentalgiana TaxID=2315210 RepID=A0A2R5G7B4_9STRA|nr:Diatom spindle kinesin-1 [Hondaea fermentalgiana]|eukprot:GBG26937.1 Diatom spindle kinesin-1 [Hondaea fermentalgiana]
MVEPGGASPRRRGGGKDRTVAEIEKLARQRANRRKSAEEFKRKRETEIKRNERKGKPGDVDFQRMIRKFRKNEMCRPLAHAATGPLKINVVVRKRPVSESEVRRKDYDSVSCSNPRVYVHHCKLKVDGITKYLDNVNFELDHAFNEVASNEEVYDNTAKYLVEFAVGGGRATCFAYGQTGSGKTFTMGGVQKLAARDVFRLIYSPEHSSKRLEVHCAFFELYGGRCIDLLHDRRVCSVREDGKGRVQVEGLKEVIVSDETELLQLIEQGNNERTTHATEMNNDSSRSHAICQIALRRTAAKEGSEPFGKLSLIDLAGSERGQDTKHHNRQRRQESAEINKSLLALKECVRALDSASSHVPYRASKLTMILKDSFSNDARTVMISCISPVSSSADHTLNTLRYADRVKEKVIRVSGPARRKSITNGAAGGGATPDPTESSYYMSSSDDDDYEDEDREESSPGRESPDSGRRVHEMEDIEEEPAEESSPDHSRRAHGNKSTSGPRHTPAKAPVPVSSPRATRGASATSAAAGISGSSRRQWDDPSADPPQLREPLQVKSPSSANVPAQRTKRSGHSNKESSGTSNEGLPEVNFQDMVAKLVDMEEEVLSAHMKAIQRNADMLTEEGVLLSKVQGSDVVDYDIEEYAARLDQIITDKLTLFTDLQGKLHNFRKHLALDEVAAKIVEN